MKKVYFLAIITLLLVFLCGCSDNRDDGKSNLLISKNAEVTMRIRESFNEDYYNIDELREMLQSEVSEYNAQTGESLIEVKKAEVTGSGYTDIEIVFSSGKDYARFNNEDMFIGSGLQADVQGWNLSVILTDPSDSAATIGQTDLKQLDDDTLMISNYSENIYLPSKVKYVSDNVTVLDDKKSVKKNSEDSGLIYVVY